MKKIAIFGCSYTHGVPEIDNGLSWALLLSKKYPNIVFDNYAFMGSSVLFQLNLFKKLKNNYDKTIFQITNPGRITYWQSGDKKEFMEQRITKNNYTYFDYNITDIQVVTPGILHQFKLTDAFWKTDKGKRQYAQLHYSKMCYELIDCEHEIYVDYITNAADLCFSQKDVYANPETENFDKDWAGHLKSDGLEWQATWVENLCKQKGIL